MASLQGFDASQVEERQEFSAIPAGTYPAIAVSSEMKPTKNGGGQMLAVTFEVLDGQFKGRKLWARMNLVNANQLAVDIAKRELGELCRAIGIIRPNDSAELHNKPLFIEVDVEKDDKDKDRNVIKKYLPANQAGGQVAAAPAQQPSFATGQPAAQATATAAPPWAKK